MRYFKETQMDSVGDFNGQEETAVAIIDSILEKIEDIINETYGADADIIIENANEIQNMAWEYVCDYSDPFDETEEDYNRSAALIFPVVDIFEIGE